MTQLINWTNGPFSSTFNLFVDGVHKGFLSFETWRNNANTVFDDQNLRKENCGICSLLYSNNHWNF